MNRYEIIGHDFKSIFRSTKCKKCVQKEFKLGCCGWQSEWTLPELIYMIKNGEGDFVRDLLTSTTLVRSLKKDGMVVKIHQAKQSSKCAFHTNEKGCFLNYLQRPIFCRLFYCNINELPDDVRAQLNSAKFTVRNLTSQMEAKLRSININLENVTFEKLSQLTELTI